MNFKSMSLYSPIANSWFDNLPGHGLWNASQIIASDKQIYVLGGVSRLDPYIRTQPPRYGRKIRMFNGYWRDFYPDVTGEIHHESCAEVGGTLYLLGGETSNGQRSISIRYFNTTKRQWDNMTATLRHPRSKFNTIVLNGSLYAVGSDRSENSNSIEKYNNTFKWSLTTNFKSSGVTFSCPFLATILKVLVDLLHFRSKMFQNISYPEKFGAKFAGIRQASLVRGAPSQWWI